MSNYTKKDSVYDVNVGMLVRIDGIKGQLIRAEVESPAGIAGWPTYTVRSWKDDQFTDTVIPTTGNSVVEVAS